MDEFAIRVDNLNKSFRLPHEKQGSIKSALINFGKRGYEEQHVLRDVNFEIKKGEFFGIVGRNGSGKSTLLKLLAGIYTPDSGQVHVRGGLTPFIELGVGFNPELTGRENVYLNGALLGFNRKDMDEMYPKIVAFAEIERFMDQKLKNYSSGMQVRLAFSIAIRAQTDILLLDEVLAVGDAAFQQKCVDVFEMYKANKQTVILVTHDMESVRRFCTRAALINKGVIEDIASPSIIADKYEKLNQINIDSQGDVKEHLGQKNATEKLPEAKYLKVNILNPSLKSQSSFNVDDKILINVQWPNMPIRNVESIGINIFKQSGEHITGINSRTGNLSKRWVSKGNITLEFDLSLRPGRYYVEVSAFDLDGHDIDSVLAGPQFNIRSTKMTWSGLTELRHKWIEELE